MRTLIFPDLVYVRAPEGTKAQARRLAKRLKTTQAEILRRALDTGLEAMKRKITRAGK